MEGITLLFPDPDEVSILRKKKAELGAFASRSGLYFGFNPSQEDTDVWADGLAHPLQIKVLVFDAGTAPITIDFTTDNINFVTETIATRTNTNKWKWFRKVLTNWLSPIHTLYALQNNAAFRIGSDTDKLWLAAVVVKETASRAVESWTADPTTPFSHTTLDSDNADDSVAGGFTFDENGVVILGSANIAGWSVTPTTFTSDNGKINFDSATPAIALGAAVMGFAVGTGIWQGKDAGVYKWRVGNPAGSQASWDGTTFAVTGAITATSGSIANWQIGVVDANTISADSGRAKLNSAVPSIALGAAVNGYMSGTGFWVGKDTGVFKFHIGNPATNYLQWDGTNLYDTGQKIGGTLAGWTVTTVTVSADSGNIQLNSDYPALLMGAAANALVGKGVFIGKGNFTAGLKYGFRIGNPTSGNPYLYWDDTDLAIFNAGIAVYNGATQTGNIDKTGAAWFGQSAAAKTIQWWTNGANAGNVRLGGSGYYALWDDTAGNLEIHGAKHKDTSWVGDPSAGVGDTNVVVVYGHIQSNDWVSGVTGTGWRMSNSGRMVARNLTLRGSLTAAVFTVNSVAAMGGTSEFAKSVGKLSANMVVPASGTWVMTLEDPPSTGYLFENGDICEVKETQGAPSTTWFTVVRIAQSGGNQTYTCTWANGARPATFEKGVGVVDFGVSGQGWVEISADDPSAPYVSIRKHTGSPWSTISEVARLGNLSGVVDTTFGALTGYGLWTNNVYLTGGINATSGAISGVLTIGTSGGFFQGTGTFASPTTALKIYNASGVGLLEMWGAGVKQVYFNTSGSLLAGAGAVALNSAGISITVTTSPADIRAYIFTDASGVLGGVYSYADATYRMVSLNVNSLAARSSLAELQADAPSGQLSETDMIAFKAGVEQAKFSVVSNNSGAAYTRSSVSMIIGSGLGVAAPRVLLDLLGTTPSIWLTDITASAKSMSLALGGNNLTLAEIGGASPNLTVWDLANGRVGIGAAPFAKLHMVTPNANDGLRIDYNGAQGAIAPSVNLYTNDPAGMASGGRIGQLAFGGWDKTALSQAAYILATATQTWSSAARGSAIYFYTTPNGATVAAQALLLGQDQSATFAGQVTVNNTLNIADNVNVTLGTTNGTKFGMSNLQKIGVWGNNPVVRGAAFTQTYSAASHTHSNLTYVAPAAYATGTFGYSTAAIAQAVHAAVLALAADLTNVKQVLNGLIDDLQAVGWAG